MSFRGYPRRGGYGVVHGPSRPAQTRESSDGHGELPRRKTRIVNLPGGFVWTDGNKYKYPMDSIIEFTGRAHIALSGCPVLLKPRYDHRLPGNLYGDDMRAVMADKARIITPENEMITHSELSAVEFPTLDLLQGALHIRHLDVLGIVEGERT